MHRHTARGNRTGLGLVGILLLALSCVLLLLRLGQIGVPAGDRVVADSTSRYVAANPQ